MILGGLMFLIVSASMLDLGSVTLNCGRWSHDRSLALASAPLLQWGTHAGNSGLSLGFWLYGAMAALGALLFAPLVAVVLRSHGRVWSLRQIVCAGLGIFALGGASTATMLGVVEREVGRSPFYMERHCYLELCSALRPGDQDSVSRATVVEADGAGEDRVDAAMSFDDLDAWSTWACRPGRTPFCESTRYCRLEYPFAAPELLPSLAVRSPLLEDGNAGSPDLLLPTDDTLRRVFLQKVRVNGLRLLLVMMLILSVLPVTLQTRRVALPAWRAKHLLAMALQLVGFMAASVLFVMIELEGIGETAAAVWAGRAVIAGCLVWAAWPVGPGRARRWQWGMLRFVFCGLVWVSGIAEGDEIALSRLPEITQLLDAHSHWIHSMAAITVAGVGVVFMLGAFAVTRVPGKGD
jgi:hypothetical protein